jgi:hypothetical protein
MIKGLNTSGRYLTVSGGSPSSTYISPGSVGSGMMRYNGNMHCIEVNDGNSWQQLQTSYATIELNSDAESLLDWARKKRQEELELDELCKKFPGLDRARNNFETFKRLVQSEKDNVHQSV